MHVSRVFSGKCELPSKAERQRKAVNEEHFWDEYFKDFSRRLSTLVEAYTYGDDVGKKCEIFCRLLGTVYCKRNPRGVLTALSALYGASETRDKGTGESEKTSTWYVLYATSVRLIMFLCLIWFDF